VVSINLFGGVVNFSETIYHPRTKLLKTSDKLESSTLFEKHDATLVFVAFLDRNTKRAFILGGVPNPNQSCYPEEKDGIHHIQEFNGLRILMNKDGEYEIVYHGGIRDTRTKETENKDTSPTIFKIDKTGAWFVEDKENQKIKIDRVKKKITIEQRENIKADAKVSDKTIAESTGAIINSITLDKALKQIIELVGKDAITRVMDGVEEKQTTTYKTGLKVEEDGKNDKITRTTKGGLKIEEDGATDKLTITTNGGLKIEVDGVTDNYTVTADSGHKIEVNGLLGIITLEADSGNVITINNSTGNIEIKAVKKVVVNAPLVDVGSAAILHSTLFENLRADFATHTHKIIGNVGPPDTSIPNNLLISIVASQTVKVKS